MIGCLHKVGYIVIPESHYLMHQGQTGSITEFEGERQIDRPYTIDASEKIFKENGLPDINSVVTINTSYYELLGTYKILDDLVAIKKYLKENPSDVETRWNESHNAATQVLKVMQFRAGNQLAAGTKVKILNYALLKEFIPTLVPQHILALVQVVEEPK